MRRAGGQSEGMDDDLGVASTGPVGVGHRRTHGPRSQDRSQGDRPRPGRAKYASRAPRPTLLGPYEAYLRERVAAWPELSGVRLLGEVRERGYLGGVTQLNDFVRAVRPPVPAPFEVRFETP